MKKCSYCAEEIHYGAIICKHCDFDIVEASKLTFKNNAYWKIDESGSKEGPYCVRCYDIDKKVVQLLPLRINKEEIQCPQCKIWTHKPK